MNENEIKKECVLEIYREIKSLRNKESEKVRNAEKELRSIENSLNEKGEEISLCEYKRLTNRMEELEKEISLNRRYYSGIYDCELEIMRFYTENLLV